MKNTLNDESLKDLQDLVSEIDQEKREILLSSEIYEIRRRANEIYSQLDYKTSTETYDDKYRELRAEIELLLNYNQSFKKNLH